MTQLLRKNGLPIALFAVFLAATAGLSVAGHRHENQERADHGRPAVGYAEYVRSAGFLEAVMENWESEFLQMFAYVLFTSFLFQVGSSESKKPDEPNSVDRDPRRSARKKDAPWPVRKGGWALRVYENSLSLALFGLFALSFILHAVGGAHARNEEAAVHGDAAVGVVEYMGTSRFWFESFQNWQSEFFSIGVLVILTIWLRQRGSAQSKPVDSPHSQTGEE